VNIDVKGAKEFTSYDSVLGLGTSLGTSLRIVLGIILDIVLGIVLGLGAKDTRVEGEKDEY
jgi:hypothetical protein